MGRKKISILHQADGKNHSIDLSKVKSVDEIFGFEKSKFQTTDAKAYESELTEMNKADLQKEATRIGLMPIDDRFVLKERILNEFRKYQGMVAASRVRPKLIKIKDKNVLDILAEGAN